MVLLKRFCLGCRRLIPEDIVSPVLAIGLMTAKWNLKKHRHVAKSVEGDCEVFCETCATKMNELIKAQQEKGAKVI